MAEIIPAIIGKNISEIRAKLEQISGLTDWIHLDVMDGTLTLASSWNTPDDLAHIEGRTKIGVHLMIQRPEENLRTWADVADRILIHAEATKHLFEITDFFTTSAVEFGLVFNLNTPLDFFRQLSSEIKLVQLMAIAEIGEQGHPFESRVLEKVKALRSVRPDVKIQVDGGISLANARALVSAGADALVIGSAIWQTNDPVATIKQFQTLLQN